MESWGRPWTASNCSLSNDKRLFVKNIKEMDIESKCQYTTSQDHSKWSIGSD